METVWEEYYSHSPMHLDTPSNNCPRIFEVDIGSLHRVHLPGTKDSLPTLGLQFYGKEENEVTEVPSEKGEPSQFRPGVEVTVVKREIY